MLRASMAATRSVKAMACFTLAQSAASLDGLHVLLARTLSARAKACIIPAAHAASPTLIAWMAATRSVRAMACIIRGRSAASQGIIHDATTGIRTRLVRARASTTQAASVASADANQLGDGRHDAVLLIGERPRTIFIPGLDA